MPADHPRRPHRTTNAPVRPAQAGVKKQELT